MLDSKPGIRQEPTLRAGKAPPPTPLVYRLHNTFCSSEVTTCCPNAWAGIEGHPLGDAGTAAFENFPQLGSRVAPGYLF